ncbi:MAG: 4-hydroxybutyrate CoA-transferase [Bacteroidia bacterium]|nr:4-hydroxybutyrate CoA-transferase [Bacteroidia bacterium]
MVSYHPIEQCLDMVQSGHRLFIHGGGATPHHLLDALVARHHLLQSVELVSISLQGKIAITRPEYQKSFKINSLFVSQNIREAIQEGRADYVPVFLSEIPELFQNGFLPLDGALVHVSPPDKHGFCSLGVSVDVARSAIRNAKYVIAQVNPRMPRTLGDGLIHVSELQSLVWAEQELPEVTFASDSPVELEIGRQVASLVEDRATLQMGIGAIPDAVLRCLGNHKDLGIHTEMFSDGVIPLVEKGVITNRYKKIYPDRIVTGFVLGTRKLYDFVHDNPMVAVLDSDFVNDVAVIRKNERVTAINSAIEIDLTGQVCADSIGTLQFSGVGGQMDFIRGAAVSPGGKPIIALPSTTSKGESKIVPFLKQGAGVVTTRAHVHYVVTEYGIANLFGKNLRQRAKALIEIAHPDHREELTKQAYYRFKQFDC